VVIRTGSNLVVREGGEYVPGCLRRQDYAWGGGRSIEFTLTGRWRQRTRVSYSNSEGFRHGGRKKTSASRRVAARLLLETVCGSYGDAQAQPKRTRMR
jgi:hypothetical protein